MGHYFGRAGNDCRGRGIFCFTGIQASAKAGVNFEAIAIGPVEIRLALGRARAKTPFAGACFVTESMKFVMIV